MRNCVLKVLLNSIFIFPIFVFGQNIVVQVSGSVFINSNKGYVSLKKGDNISNSSRLKFVQDSKQLRPAVKMITPKGICLIGYNDFEKNTNSELLDLIKASIHKNSVATLGTRSIGVTPSIQEQVRIVDSLCKVLKADKDNIDYIVTTYINPYCVSEFISPYWSDIGKYLFANYGLKFINQTGNSFTNEEFSKIPKIAKISTRGYLSNAFSLKKYCPIPGNQGDFGTCVGWSSAYGARTISWAIKNNNTNPLDITNQSFSPTFIYEKIKNALDYNCSIGASLYNAVNILKTTGVPFKSDLDGNCNINVNPFNSIASNYAIKDYQALTDKYGLAQSDVEFDSNLKNIKQAIAEKKPVLASIRCYKSFDGRIWNGVTDVDRGGHAVCIIGYDDNFANGEGVVEILNSWGPYWGNGGFIYVKYADLKKILTSAISLYDDTKASPLIPLVPEIKKDTLIPTLLDSMVRMSGSFTLELSDGSYMPIETDQKGVRGLKLTQVENMTYNVSKSYTSGTLFKILFTSNEPCYVYVIGSDSKKSPISQLFPDEENNVSALLDFKSEVSVSIPEGKTYIQMDENSGEDYLCIIYSKDQLDISLIRKKFENNTSRTFVSSVKESLNGKIVNEEDIKFQKDKIAFKSVSKDKTAVPIFIKIKHQ